LKRSKSAIPLAELSQKFKVERWTKKPPRVINKVRIDSRNCEPGDLFVALQGENTHGHRFLQAAHDNGAVAAIVEREQDVDIPQLLVEDSEESLGRLAKFYRRTLDDYVIGITGSCGKTTVKEMLTAVLSEKYQVHRSPGNYNNQLGLPLTILNYGGADILVAEVAMNQPGEIKRLTEILAPDMGLIAHIGRAHLAGLETVESVAREKAELLAGLPPDGLGIVPGWVRYKDILLQSSTAPARVPSRSAGGDVEVDWSIGPGVGKIRVGENKFEVTFTRDEILKDAILVILAAFELGLEETAIREGLARFEPLAGRGQEIMIGETTVIDGSYNANPDSMLSAIERLEELSPPRLAVLGTMKELGDQAPEAHREIGEKLSEVEDLEVKFVGEYGKQLAKGMGGDPNLSLHETVEELNGLVPTSYRSVLIKGSNAVGLSKLIERWKTKQ